MWVLFAFGSAVFAGLTAILSKIGIRDTDTDVAIALRTAVVLLFSWAMAWLTGSITGLSAVSARTWVFLALSGMATGGSWLCYFRALQIGDINKVAPIQKSSTVLTMALAFLLLGEPLTPYKMLSMALIGTGAYLMIQRKAPHAAKVAAASSAATQAEALVDAAEGNAAQDSAMVLEAPVLPIASEGQVAMASDGEAIAAAQKRPAWLWYAIGAAVFASLTSILGKIGIENVNSTLGTAIRTCVVLVMAWAIVFGRGKQSKVRSISRTSILFLILSGFATGASWLCYYRALQTGPASVVVPIDKLSILLSIAFSRIFLGERLTPKAALGLALLVAGTLILLL